MYEDPAEGDLPLGPVLNSVRGFTSAILRAMIDQAWKWAKENKKIIVSPIHGGEVVSLPVEALKKQTHAEGSAMRMAARREFQDTACVCAKNHGSCRMILAVSLMGLVCQRWKTQGLSQKKPQQSRLLSCPYGWGCCEDQRPTGEVAVSGHDGHH